MGRTWKNLPEVVHSKIIQNSEQGWLVTGCYSQFISPNLYLPSFGVVIHPHVTSPGWSDPGIVVDYSYSTSVLNTHLHMHQKWWTQNFGRFQIPEIWHLGKAVFPAPSTRQLRSSEPVQVKVPASSLSGHRLLSWVWHLKISGIPVEFKKSCGWSSFSHPTRYSGVSHVFKDENDGNHLVKLMVAAKWSRRPSVFLIGTLVVPQTHTHLFRKSVLVCK